MTNIEVGLEDQRNQLDFSIESAFLLFTNSTLNKITQKELDQGLNMLGICSQNSDLIIKRFDADSDEKLCFWEFQNIFLPLDVNKRTKIEKSKV